MNAPPLLVGFSSVESLLTALAEDARFQHEEELKALVQRGLPPAISINVLSVLFGISTNFVRSMYRAPHRYYRRFKIRKGKKTREINAPRVGLKLLQKWIGAHLERAITFPDCVFGFVQGLSAIDAARLHCGATWVYSVDIRDFFPSITSKQVTRALGEFGYSKHAQEVIAGLCTLDGCLPQGSPASPVLSNIVFFEIDERLKALAASKHVRYTRYADDIVFSGVDEPPVDLAQAVNDLIQEGGWQIAKEKEQLARLPYRLKVHGLLVHGLSPRLTKGYRNRVRAYRHLLAAGKIKQQDQARIKGHLAYAALVSSKKSA